MTPKTLAESDEDQPIICDLCGDLIEDGVIYWVAEGKIYCECCLPEDAKRIGERH